MVVRVALVLSCLALCVCMAPADMGIAGGPAACPPSYGPAPCGPAIPACGPPRCGPPNPLTACGAIINSCTGICGVCLALPSALMRGLLAPPPCRPRCGPRPFARRAWAAPPVYPMYAPLPPPVRPIAKCRPAVAPAARPPVPYVAPRPMACGPFVGRRCGGPPAVPGCFALCTQLLAIPARLVSGALFSEPAYGMPFADGAAGSTFGHYW